MNDRTWQRMAVALLVVALVVAPTSALAAPDTQGGGYVVQYGDTLADIAASMGISLWALAEANGIHNVDLIYVDQVLVVPGESGYALTGTDTTTVYAGSVYDVRWGDSAADDSSDSYSEPDPEPSGGRWIDIDLSEQVLTAYQGDTAVFSSLVSTGIDGLNTPAGEFAIEAKVDSQTMSGPDYYLPDVPYVMYFYGADAIHGTYWHNNFGSPMSHGCVNLPTDAAGWLYNWASIGTPVVTHY